MVTRVLGWLTVSSILLSSGLAESRNERGRPILLGGPLPQGKAEIKLDPRLPPGALRYPGIRPESNEPPACSFRYPVCVRRTKEVPAPRALSTLASLERAYRRLVVVLGLPAPHAGVGTPLDLYLTDQGPTLVSELDALGTGPHDSGSSFCVSSAQSQRLLERSATQCVGEAIARHLDAGATPHVRRAFATSLWWATDRPTALDVQAIDDVQQRPEQAIVTRDRTPYSDGAALWFEQLEQTRGLSDPAVLSTQLVSLAASTTPSWEPRWHNEPDVFEVLRHSTGLDQVAYARLLNRFAIDRSFLGSRDDGSHLPNLAWAGDFGRVRFDWALKYSSLPRRVASRQGIAPTGSFHLLLELDEVALNATLAFQAKWERPVAFAWSLVQLDSSGHELKRLDVPFKAKSTSAEQRLADFHGAAYILVVGTNLGGLSAEHPFDPDLAPFETHGCNVYLAVL